MQELIDFDSVPVVLNKTKHSGPVLDHQTSHAIPALMQLSAAATTVGRAPEPAVQEAGTGLKLSRPSISMQDVMDVDSILSAHHAAHGFAPETMHVFPQAATCSHDPWFNGPAVLHESVPTPSRIIPPWGPKDADMHEAQAQVHAPQMHKTALNHNDNFDALSRVCLWDDQDWSEAEQEHQMARQRRKAKQALSHQAKTLPSPPAIAYTITLPEKFSCPELPSLGQMDSFEEALVTEFRSFTSMGEPAEENGRIPQLRR